MSSSAHLPVYEAHVLRVVVDTNVWLSGLIVPGRVLIVLAPSCLR
jgi:hypothetical protein